MTNVESAYVMIGCEGIRAFAARTVALLIVRRIRSCVPELIVTGFPPDPGVLIVMEGINTPDLKVTPERSYCWVCVPLVAATCPVIANDATVFVSTGGEVWSFRILIVSGKLTATGKPFCTSRVSVPLSNSMYSNAARGPMAPGV